VAELGFGVNQQWVALQQGGRGATSITSGGQSQRGRLAGGEVEACTLEVKGEGGGTRLKIETNGSRMKTKRSLDRGLMCDR
jgi:hypothetical protein